MTPRKTSGSNPGHSDSLSTATISSSVLRNLRFVSSELDLLP